MRTADAGALRLDKIEHQLHRDGGVHRAAGREILRQGGSGGERIGRRHHVLRGVAHGARGPAGRAFGLLGSRCGCRGLRPGRMGGERRQTKHGRGADDDVAHGRLPRQVRCREQSGPGLGAAQPRGCAVWPSSRP
jgi:hypothetical protein